MVTFVKEIFFVLLRLIEVVIQKHLDAAHLYAPLNQDVLLVEEWYQVLKVYMVQENQQRYNSEEIVGRC